jgi:outer membrane protein assembly factor BamA
LLLAAGILFAGALPLAAQKLQPKTIQFKGDPEYSEKELLAASGLKPGVVVTSPELNDRSKSMMDTGMFDSLTYRFDGADLIFNLIPASLLYPIRLENLPLTPGAELDGRLHDRFPLYHGKVPATGGMLESVRGALEDMLAAQGIKATVTATLYTDFNLQKVTAMGFAIPEPPVQVGEIHLEGVSPEMQSKVKAVVERAGKTNYNTQNSAGNLERALSLFYSDEGYAAVKVHAEESGHPIVSSAAIEVPFNVTVKEGQHYTLGSIHLPSGELLTVAEINKSAAIVSNAIETMSIKGGVTLRSAVRFVTQECKSEGHMNCVVTPHPQYDDANSIANYTFEVQPGPIYTMGKLTIENAGDDLRTAMLAAWKLPAGAVFSEKAIQDYYASQGNKTALGRTFASLNCKYKLAANEDTHIVDVTLSLEKKQ